MQDRSFVYQGFSVSTEALAARVLAPDEPDLARVRAVIRAYRSPRESWEALISRGILPLDWAQDERRIFALAGRGRQAPSEFGAVARLAAAPQQALAAERLVRSSAERAASFMLTPDSGVALSDRPILWRFVKPSRRKRTSWAGGRGTLSDLNSWVHITALAHAEELGSPVVTEQASVSGWRATVDAVLSRLRLRPPSPKRPESWDELCAQARSRSFGMLEGAMVDLRLAWTWDALAAIGAATRDHVIPFPGPRSSLGARFSALPNPYEPRVALWLSGYAPRLVLPEAIELVTVSATLEESAPSKG